MWARSENALPDCAALTARLPHHLNPYLSAPPKRLSALTPLPTILSDANETKLYNAVIAFDTELAKKLIGEYTRNISDSHLLRHLYTQIINTIFRAMRAKGMLDAELLDEYISATGKSSEAIYRYILKLLSAADAYKSAADSSSGSYEIIEYIKKNYRDSSLSLESLATLFNVTSGYISQQACAFHVRRSF